MPKSKCCIKKYSNFSLSADSGKYHDYTRVPTSNSNDRSKFQEYLTTNNRKLQRTVLPFTEI